MKRILRFTAELIEELDDEFSQDYAELSFNEWRECDYDNVGRPINRLEDCGWIIKNKKVINGDN